MKKFIPEVHDIGKLVDSKLRRMLKDKLGDFGKGMFLLILTFKSSKFRNQLLHDSGSSIPHLLR